MKKKIICSFDLRKEGHTLTHLVSLLKYADNINKSESLFFLLNDSSKELIIDKYKSIIFISPEDTEYIENSSNSHIKAFRKFKILKKYHKLLKFDEVVFLDEFDYMIIPIILIRFNFLISGILFRPIFRQPFKYIGAKEIIKLLFHISLSFKPKVKKIFIFNDIKAVKFYNSIGLRIYELLPDPVINLKQEYVPNLDLRAVYNIGKEKKIILVFGALSERKNIINLTKALLSIGNDLEKYALIVAGTCSKEYSNVLINVRNEFLKIHPCFNFILKIEYIDDYFVDSLFRNADIIYMAYKNFYYSSGVLGIAANYNKIAIVPTKSIMSDLTGEYMLGYCVNPELKDEICNILKLILIENNRISKYDLFCKHYSIENFIYTLLN